MRSVLVAERFPAWETTILIVVPARSRLRISGLSDSLPPRTLRRV
jgi:hypothetical protein